MIKNILIAAAIGAAAFGAQASTNLITNGGFEDATIGGPNAGDYCYTIRWGSCSAAGWSPSLLITSGSGAWGVPSASAGSIAVGDFVAGIQQNDDLTSDVVLHAGYTYLLTWDDAGRAGYSDHAYDVLASGATVGSFTTAYGGQSWSEHSLSFTAGADGALVFDGIATSWDGTTFIDNVSLSVTSVPEPANVVLVLAGVLALVASRRRAQV